MRIFKQTALMFLTMSSSLSFSWENEVSTRKFLETDAYDNVLVTKFEGSYKHLGVEYFQKVVDREDFIDYLKEDLSGGIASEVLERGWREFPTSQEPTLEALLERRLYFYTMLQTHSDEYGDFAEFRLDGLKTLREQNDYRRRNINRITRINSFLSQGGDVTKGPTPNSRPVEVLSVEQYKDRADRSLIDREFKNLKIALSQKNYQRYGSHFSKMMYLKQDSTDDYIGNLLAASHMNDWLENTPVSHLVQKLFPAERGPSDVSFSPEMKAAVNQIAMLSQSKSDRKSHVAALFLISALESDRAQYEPSELVELVKSSSYQDLIERLSEHSGMSQSEVKTKIQEQINKL